MLIIELCITWQMIKIIFVIQEAVKFQQIKLGTVLIPCSSEFSGVFF